jgi:hypothetical protein
LQTQNNPLFLGNRFSFSPFPHEARLRWELAKMRPGQNPEEVELVDRTLTI